MLSFELVDYNCYYTLKAYSDQKYVANLDFNIKYGSPHLVMIWVDSTYRRRRIATEMLKYIQLKYNKDIIWNGKTHAGEMLYKSFYI
jgi:ribosomal protein S18 acetylase RimI-like enzyme